MLPDVKIKICGSFSRPVYASSMVICPEDMDKLRLPTNENFLESWLCTNHSI